MVAMRKRLPELSQEELEEDYKFKLAVQEREAAAREAEAGGQFSEVAMDKASFSIRHWNEPGNCRWELWRWEEREWTMASTHKSERDAKKAMSRLTAEEKP